MVLISGNNTNYLLASDSKQADKQNKPVNKL